VIKANKYKAAEDMLANKQYDEAITTFAELKDYKDSADMILESKYLQAKDSYNSGFYEAALSEYSELNEYKDSAEMVISSTNQIDYKAAMSSYNDEDYLTAVEGFEKLGDFANSVEMFEKSKEMLYNQAITDLNNNNYENLGARFEFLSQYDYKDSSQKLENIKQTFNRISGVYSGYKDFGYNIRTKLVVAIVAEYDTGKVNFITKTNNDEAISLYYIYNPSTGGTYGSYIQNMYTIYNGYIIDSIYETKLTKGL
jgi:tetratricopeptide (TPR) repeat protein